MPQHHLRYLPAWDDDKSDAEKFKEGFEEFYFYLGLICMAITASVVAWASVEFGIHAVSHKWNRGPVRQTPAYKLTAAGVMLSGIISGIYLASKFTDLNKHEKNKYPLERVAHDYMVGALAVGACTAGSGVLWFVLSNLDCLCKPNPSCCPDEETLTQARYTSETASVTLFSSQAQNATGSIPASAEPVVPSLSEPLIASETAASEAPHTPKLTG